MKILNMTGFEYQKFLKQLARNMSDYMDTLKMSNSWDRDKACLTPIYGDKYVLTLTGTKNGDFATESIEFPKDLIESHGKNHDKVINDMIVYHHTSEHKKEVELNVNRIKQSIISLKQRLPRDTINKLLDCTTDKQYKDILNAHFKVN